MEPSEVLSGLGVTEVLALKGFCNDVFNWLSS